MGIFGFGFGFGRERKRSSLDNNRFGCHFVNVLPANLVRSILRVYAYLSVLQLHLHCIYYRCQIRVILF